MSGTVSVACKIPNGLILRLFHFVEEAEPVMGGGSRMRRVARAVGDSVMIKGYAKPFGEEPRAPIIGGYAITHGVDADFFEEWLNQNRDADYVRNRLVFAHEKPEDTSAQAKEQRDVWDGLGPIIPGNDRRIPKRPGTNKPAVEKYDPNVI